LPAIAGVYPFSHQFKLDHYPPLKWTQTDTNRLRYASVIPPFIRIQTGHRSLLNTNIYQQLISSFFKFARPLFYGLKRALVAII